MFEGLPPELQIEIFGHLANYKQTLASAVLVNKFWFDNCTILLWENLRSNHKRLAGLSRGRRQLYANKVRYLDLSDQESYFAFKDLLFPSLESFDLSGDGINSSSETWIRPYAQPKLRTLSIQNHSLPVESLAILQTYCGGLRDLTLMNLGDVNVSYLIEFLQSTQSLRSLSFGDEADDAVANQTLAGLTTHLPSRLRQLRLNATVSPVVLHNFLVRCESLEELDYTTWSDGFIMDKTLACLPQNTFLGFLQIMSTPQGQSPVTTLSSRTELLGLTGMSADLNPLICVLPISILKLELGVLDAEPSVCNSISRLNRLQQLQLEYQPQHELLLEDLDALVSLQRLQSLTIKVDDYADLNDDGKERLCLQLPWLRDEDFDNWIQRFPELRLLELYWECPALTTASIFSIARHCSQLRVCGFGLPAWVESGDTMSSEEIDECVRVVDEMAPKLHTLRLWTPYESWDFRWKSESEGPSA